MFTIELVQAINNWQMQRIGDDKQQLASEIKKYSKKLPQKFKVLPNTCYRKIDLNAIDVLNIGLNLKISESISSWTIDEKIVQKFKGGVPQKGLQGIILKLSQHDSYEVILNLDALFDDKNFISACKSYETNDIISNYHMGIGMHGNTEKEIIIEVDELPISSIWAYGGFSFSASLEELFYNIFGYVPSSSIMKEFEKYYGLIPKSLGPNWINDEVKVKKLNSYYIRIVQELDAMRNSQSNL